MVPGPSRLGRTRAGRASRLRGVSASALWWWPALLGVLAVTGCGAADGLRERPEHVVLIVVDTLRRDHLSIYGSELETPNIARLAARGVAIENALASFHQTTLSMGALFSGRTPSLESGDPERALARISPNWCGLARFRAEGAEEACVPERLFTLGELMREQGYWSAAVVANRLLFRPAGFDAGFDRWEEVGVADKASVLANPGLSANQRTGAHVNTAVRELLAERPDEPTFLYVHYMDVHDWNQRHMTYAESVEAVDRAIGELWGVLEAHGLWGDALIVLISDHGETLGEPHLLQSLPTHFGNPSFEPVLRVPLVVVGAEVEESDVPIRSEDVYHLLAELVGNGGSEERDLEADELFLTEAWYRTYRTGRWKSYWRRADGDFRLVDLSADPGETRDVAGAHPEVAAAHRQRMNVLTRQLAAPGAIVRDLTEWEREILSALGYLENTEKTNRAAGPGGASN
ncbi:MAG: sulfatase-like hydrolase/transferase [Deltaproteobacteria bacterium]|nr:sulfatase-like hydrolase/transferase [Deltaproteobacteria bacterium]